MNAKNKKIIIILVVALLVAGVAAVAVYFYLVPQKTTVYVFKDNYSAGEIVTEEMLTPIQCDSKIVVAGQTSETSSRFVTGQDIKTVLNTGDSLRMDVSVGMPLTLALLSVNGGSSVEMAMDPTKIAVSIPVNSISGVTDELKEGSRVNIYSTGIDTTGTKLLFQNMRVLFISYDSGGALASATIEVTIEESLKLIYAKNYSTLDLGLVDNSSYEHSEESEPSYTPDQAKGTLT